MARFPDWFPHLDALLATLAEPASPDRLGRREIGRLFGTGDRDSLRLLHRFGAQPDGPTLTVERTALQHQLDALRDTAPYRAFLRKRGAVGQAVATEAAAAQAAQPAQERRIEGTVDFVGGLRITDLPPEISLEPGRLIVTFRSTADLWRALDQLANVAAADRKAFDERAGAEP